MSFLDLVESQHRFPTHYMHKVVGKNSEAFRKAVDELLAGTARLKKAGEKLSSNSAHVSITFDLHAHSAHEIVFLVERSQQLKDVLFVL